MKQSIGLEPTQYTQKAHWKRWVLSIDLNESFTVSNSLPCFDFLFVYLFLIQPRWSRVFKVNPPGHIRTFVSL